jgi:hypothetical protein
MILWLLTYLLLTLQEEAAPPPIAFSDWVADAQIYYIYDFETGDVSPITRPADFDSMIGISLHPQPFFELQSPYDAAQRLTFRSNLSTDGMPTGNYSVSLINSEAEQKLAIDNVISNLSDIWSSNGQYIYLLADPSHAFSHTLYQYHLKTKTLKVLLEDVSMMNQCSPTDEFCIILQRKSQGEDVTFIYSTLEKNTGVVTSFNSLTTTHLNFWWTEDGLRLLYFSVSQDRKLAFHSYDTLQNMGEFLGDVDDSNLYFPVWNGKRGWLSFMAAHENRTDVYFVSIDEQTPLRRLTTKLEDGVTGYALPMHLVDDKVFYAMQENEKLIFYLTDPLTEQVRELGRFGELSGLYDHEWSPDNQWLAISFFAAEDEPSRLYVVGMDGGGIREVPTDLMPTESLTCIGWFEPEVYKDGKALLCDIFMGEGS